MRRQKISYLNLEIESKERFEDRPLGGTSNKTGSNFYDEDRKIHLGWFISHIQNANQEYISVANFSDLAPTETGV